MAVLNHEIVCCRQFFDLFEGAKGRRKVLQGQIVIDTIQIGFARYTRPGQNRFDFGGKEQGVVVPHIVQRFFAGAVARQQHALVVRIPQCESEHAAEVVEYTDPPLLIAVDDDLGVAMVAEAMAALLQLFAQFDEIIDFAVEDQVYLIVVVTHRLAGGIAQVDD